MSAFGYAEPKVTSKASIKRGKTRIEKAPEATKEIVLKKAASSK
jgi:hypothetical protein